MLKEFKSFVLRGNVMDLAIGVIIGVAFGAIVTSLVNDIIMPPIGVLLGGVDFSDLFINLGPGDYPNLAAAKEAAAPVIAWGSFVNTIVNFLIVAFAIFITIGQISKMLAKPSAPPPPPAATKSEVLLEEIRDLLKKQA